MLFADVRDVLLKHFDEMTKDKSHMFSVLVDKDYMYNLYLDSFPEGTNLIFRQRREFDCSCCRGFIKAIGNAVTINHGVVESIWDVETGDNAFDIVFKKLSDYVKSCAVEDVYLSKFKKIGCHHNFEMIERIGPKQWDHFYLELPDRFIINNSRSKGDVLSEYRDTRNVFKRSLDTISMDAITTVIDMIDENSLYRGSEWINQIKKFKECKNEYDVLETDKKELYAWEKSVQVGHAVGRIRNHSIGTLLVNLSEGMDVETAVKKYEEIVAPTNYKRSKPIFTAKMLEEAQKKITDLGYLDSLPRRFAKLDDITVNDILYCNRNASQRIVGAKNIFDELMKNASGKKMKGIEKATEITVDKFVDDVLPNAKDIELYFENKHKNNLVSLIAPQVKESKSMFKWGNNFSWAYAGNLTDSEIKERVKTAGGGVTGDLRFSIQWNEDGKDNYDLDAHCIEADNHEIYYGNKTKISRCGGVLDVDIIDPAGKIAVENITYANKSAMKDGEYKFFVHQYSGSVRNGFRAEIEFDGKIYSYDYPNSMRVGEKVVVATVILKDGHFSIKENLNSTTKSKQLWGISTNNFIPVNAICYSPNYWDNTTKKSGHKHILFMLNGCVNDENPSGMFNEYLVNDLYEHRKVTEALASKMRVEDDPDQMSGIGFAIDKKNDVIVKVTDDTEKFYKIVF